MQEIRCGVSQGAQTHNPEATQSSGKPEGRQTLTRTTPPCIRIRTFPLSNFPLPLHPLSNTTMGFYVLGTSATEKQCPESKPYRACSQINRSQRLSHLHEDIGKQTAAVLRDSLETLSPATLSTVPCDKTEAESRQLVQRLKDTGLCGIYACIPIALTRLLSYESSKHRIMCQVRGCALYSALERTYALGHTLN